IYPGWYPGRTVHIHSKVHLDKRTVLTTQFYFDDGFTDRVLSIEPYASDTGRDAFNDSDPLYERDLELSLSKDGDAYLGLIPIDAAAHAQPWRGGGSCAGVPWAPALWFFWR